MHTEPMRIIFVDGITGEELATTDGWHVPPERSTVSIRARARDESETTQLIRYVVYNSKCELTRLLPWGSVARMVVTVALMREG